MTEASAKRVCYFDTNVFIGAFEMWQSEQAADLMTMFRTLRDVPFAGVTSEITIAELLSASGGTPFEQAKSLYQKLLIDSKFIDLRAVTLDLLVLAADLRRRSRYKLPDAIHVATAVRSGCSFFMSADRGMKTLPVPMQWLRPGEAGIATVLKALGA